MSDEIFKYPQRRPDLNYPQPGAENKALSYIKENRQYKVRLLSKSIFSTST